MLPLSWTRRMCRLPGHRFAQLASWPTNPTLSMKASLLTGGVSARTQTCQSRFRLLIAEHLAERFVTRSLISGPPSMTGHVPRLRVLRVATANVHDVSRSEERRVG